MDTSRSWTDEQLISAIPAAASYADVVRALGLSVKSAGNWRTVKRHIERLDIDISHFTHKRGTHAGGGSKRPLEDILVKGIDYPSSKLRERLLNEGIKKPKCEGCSRRNWNGMPIALELDHVDGDPHNNEIDNLRLLCPNCHAQTPTWRGRNIKHKATRIIPRCKCGNEKERRSIQCKSCNDESYQIVTEEELRVLVWERPIIEVAAALGVTDVAIHKRCERWSIDKPPRGYWLRKHI